MLSRSSSNQTRSVPSHGTRTLALNATPQYPDGPVIAVQSENEFFQSTASNPGRSESMVQIEDNLRGNGIVKIPM